MKCLVVTAHPLPDSLCAALTRTVVGALAEAGHEVTVDDLYASGFDPVLSGAERATYYAVYDATDVAARIETLRRSEALVLVFPTWWFGFPAILKGWFDRVWAPGHAFDHADDLGPITPRLDRLRRVLVVTTVGAPWWVDRLLMGRPVRRIVKRALLGACARNSRFDMLSLYKAEKLERRRVDRFAARIRRRLGGWR